MRPLFQTSRPFIVLCLFLLGPALQAHKVTSIRMVTDFTTAAEDETEGRYETVATMVVIPTEEEEGGAQITPEQAVSFFFSEDVDFLVDKVAVKPEMKIETVTISDPDTPVELQNKQVVAELSGTFPATAKTFHVYAKPSCQMSIVWLTNKDGKTARRLQVILPGEYSRTVSLLRVEEGDPFNKAEEASAKKSAQDTPSSEAPETAGLTYLNGFYDFLYHRFLPIACALAVVTAGVRRRTFVVQAGLFLVFTAVGAALCLLGVFPSSMWGRAETVIGRFTDDSALYQTAFLGYILAALCLDSIMDLPVKWWRYMLLCGMGILLGALSIHWVGMLGAGPDPGGLSYAVGTVLAAAVTILLPSIGFFSFAEDSKWKFRLRALLALGLALYGIILGIVLIFS